jgi:integrase
VGAVRLPVERHGLDRGILIVQRPVLQLGGKVTESKTRAGERKVFLDAETAELLREHRKAQIKARMQAGAAWQDNDLVFCQPDGRPWNPDHMTRRFQRLAKNAGVPVLTLHEGGRHTGNSLMRAADVLQDLRMREVGHADRSGQRPLHHILIDAHLAAEQVAALVRKASVRHDRHECSPLFPAAAVSQPAGSRVSPVQPKWGGWDSNPGPADYESAALTG